MRILGGLFGIMMVLSAGSTAAVEARPAGPEESWDDRKVHRLVTQMTVEEKLSFVYWNYNLDDPLEKLWLPGVPRLGIPQLSGTDGPAGVTISRPAVAMPAPVALASTFDEDLARKYGEVLGREGRAARQDVILGPMVNNIRVPQAGRNFETFSEDPLLTGRIAASQVRGVQSQGLMTSVKHYAANTQETDRYTTDVDIDERTLREIELPGFEAPIRAGASSVMCAYPKVNGTFACSNETLLTSILREQWDFEGWVMSDWGAAHATEDIEAGLDQEMGVDVNPDGSLAPGKFFGDALGRAIEEGRIPESRLDTSVTRILTQMERFGLLDADPPARPERDGAGGVAVIVRVQVNADFTVLNIAELFGEYHLRGRMKPLPIGRVVACGFGLKILARPMGEGRTQGLFGTRAAVLAVEVFEPGFKRAFGLPVEPADQYGFPVVPCVRADAADIADGQHTQQIKPFDGLHSLGKVPHGARIGNIAFLRHIRHQQVVADQPFDRVDLGLVEAQTGRDLAGHLGSEDRMVFGAALGDIMQQ